MPGGPGWLSDIFDCQFVFDESSYTLVPNGCEFLQQAEKIKRFDGRGAISGKLIIVPPEGRDINHNGIEITLASNSLVAADMAATYPVVFKTWVLLEAGNINEPIECPFDIDLSELKLRDTFDGANMSFQHVISYRVIRPWYTFSVRGEEPISIVNCATPSPPLPEKTVLVVDDFGAVCTFDHGKCTFSADGQLVGTVTLSNMSAASPVSEVGVMLGRTEKWTLNSALDAEVRVHWLHTVEQAPLEMDTTLAVDISLPSMNAADGGKVKALAPTMPPLVPCDPSTDEKHVVEVEYWLRLLVSKPPSEPGQKEGSKHWDTHPIILEPCSDGFGL